ncbi:MAG: methyl-accepting chemotaxis protein [Crocosphaera sp.]|nr:methyl-accepting chemotaxis protein [Crocosphaera sp.]
MTIQEKFLNLVSWHDSQDTDHLILESTQQPISPSQTDQKKPTLKKAVTLRRRLLITILPTVLIPLGIASQITVQTVYADRKQDIFEDTEKTMVETSSLTKQFLEQAFKVSDVLGSSPYVVDSLQSGTEKVNTLGLLQQPIDQVEQEFASDKLLSPNPNLNNYLATIAKANDLAEIILTERNGYNVGYNLPTSDFVQKDEQWWQIGEKQGATILEPEFDESTQSAILELVNTVKHPQTKEVLGVTKIGVSIAKLDEKLALTIGVRLLETQTLQLVDVVENNETKVLNTLTVEEVTELGDLVGGDVIAKAIRLFDQTINKTENQESEGQLSQNNQQLEQAFMSLEGRNGISKVKFEGEEQEETASLVTERNILSFKYQDKYFHIKQIPDTELIVVSSIEEAEIAAQGRKLTTIFALTALVLGGVATGMIILLSQKLSEPLTNLVKKAEQAAEGDLDVEVPLEGTQETRILGDSFNNLVTKVKGLVQEQVTVAQQKQQEKEQLEQEIYQLLEELQEAVDGDLTVRASLTSMEMSTVADLFNAVIDSLQDIAIQVKNSSARVNTALGEDKQSIERLAQQASQEAEATLKTLGSVDEMSQSIQAVAVNANQAATLADDTYHVTQEGSKAMDDTVNSIVSLKTTIAQTAEKMEQLEKSSQKISQVVSLIEEMTLKTNLLAINAGRSGEQGEGFAIFGEQLALLAEQSATATREIANIVANIQRETQEVAYNMTLGTTQVNDTTQLVEATKGQLEQVLERSRNINDLMKSISDATISQTDTSQTVTQLMEQMAQYSKQRLVASETVAHSMEETAQVAQELEAAVEQFKVEK